MPGICEIRLSSNYFFRDYRGLDFKFSILNAVFRRPCNVKLLFVRNLKLDCKKKCKLNRF